jgi:hypothetical protein
MTLRDERKTPMQGNRVKVAKLGFPVVSWPNPARRPGNSVGSQPKVRGDRAEPHRHQDRVWVEAIHPLLVMPGLDPGTPATAGIRGDHRVKPGDDDGDVWRLGQNNSSPDTYQGTGMQLRAGSECRGVPTRGPERRRETISTTPNRGAEPPRSPTQSSPGLATTVECAPSVPNGAELLCSGAFRGPQASSVLTNAERVNERAI